MADDSPVFRVLLRTHVQSGKEDEFEGVWTDVASAIGRQPANLGQWLMRSAGEPNVYYILTDWADEAQFRTFERSEDHVGHRARLKPYRSGDSMTAMHVVRALDEGGELLP
jgi:heme oxygenase (mycobilin-producing)